MAPQEMNQESLRLLEFPQVVLLFEEFAQTDPGREALATLHPFQDPPALRHELRLLRECLRFREENSPPSLSQLDDPRPLLDILGIEGNVLGGENLLILADWLAAGLNLAGLLEPTAWPLLAAHFPIPVDDFRALRHDIEGVVDSQGNVREEADPELSSVRRRLARTRKKIHQKLGAYFKGKQARLLIQEPFVTHRNNRYVIPVRTECQHSLPGVVHGTSSSGATVFVEPLPVVELNNDVLLCEEREQEIIYRILSHLTARLRIHVGQLEHFCGQVGAWDALCAKVDFHKNYHCVVPELSSEEALSLTGARHPLLQKRLGYGSIVPVDLSLDAQRSVLIISGPNTGGKTVALKTTGLLVLMALSGLPVPALEATVPCFRQVLADIGDHQSISENLSTYSAHILRATEMMELLDLPSLILLDEVGAGTDPVYGAGLGTAIIDHFRSEGAFVVATTHHQAVKQYAAQQTQAVNASVELDPRTLLPTYHLRPGLAAGSSALEIADQLGLPRSVLERARQMLDDKEIQVEKYLSLLRAETESVARSRELVNQELDSLKHKQSELELDFRKKEESRRRELERALQKWGEEFRKDAHRVIDSISDRFEAARMKQRLKVKEAQLRETFRRKMERPVAPDPGHQETAPAPDLMEGDWVYDAFFRKRGQVVELSGGGVILLVDGKRIKSKRIHLTKLEKKEVRKEPIPAVTLEVVEDTDPELNLIGCTVEEALEKTDKFLDRAFVSALSQVRIVHGFGTGRLKNAIASLLNGHPQVKDSAIEGGATVVTLKN